MSALIFEISTLNLFFVVHDDNKKNESNGYNEMNESDLIFIGFMNLKMWKF
jgi:hypothetical protein